MVGLEILQRDSEDSKDSKYSWTCRPSQAPPVQFAGEVRPTLLSPKICWIFFHSTSRQNVKYFHGLDGNYVSWGWYPVSGLNVNDCTKLDQTGAAVASVERPVRVLGVRGQGSEVRSLTQTALMVWDIYNVLSGQTRAESLLSIKIF